MSDLQYYDGSVPSVPIEVPVSLRPRFEVVHLDFRLDGVDDYHVVVPLAFESRLNISQSDQI